MSLSEYFTSLANKMRSKTGKAAAMTPSEMVSEVDAVYQAGVNSIQTQTKTVTAGTAATTVNPDSGKLLSSVTVNPTPSQAKTAAAANEISYANGATITPDSGKYLSSVSIPKPFGGDLSAAIKLIRFGHTTSPLSSITLSNSRSEGNLFLTPGIYIFTLFDQVHGPDVIDSPSNVFTNVEKIRTVKTSYNNGSKNATVISYYIVKVTSTTWSMQIISSSSLPYYDCTSLKIANV